MNEMTEDDEAKQRAHEVANQSQCLYAQGSVTDHNNDKTKGVQISKQSPMIETRPVSQTSERNIEDHDRMSSVKDRVAGDNQESVTSNESMKEVASKNQNDTQDQNEQKSSDRPNHDQQTITSNRQNRRHNHHNNNNNNNYNSPNNHQRKLQYTPSVVMSQDGTMAAGLGPLVSADYLAQLIKDKKQLAAFPSTVLLHVPRLVEEEIQRVRQQLFQLNDVVSPHQQPLELPEPDGEFVSLQEKIYVPVEQHPEYNFVGRLLGPRGMTAKQLEQETGCKIMIRGKGSMRDKKKEEQNRGKANWEHLNDDLHVLITVEDTQSRAQVKLGRAIQEVKQLLVPVVDGEDELKKRQLMELAIINGTYRDCNYNEALSKMLSDAAYRQSQLVEHGSPTSSGQQQLMTSAAATASASSSGSPPNGSLSAQRHLITHLQHYPSSTTASTTFDGSSGFPSTGSTPNSLHHGTSHQQVATSSQHPHSRHQSHPHHGPPSTHHHHPTHLNHPTTVAVVAAAAAAAAAQQHHQASGPPQTASSHHHQLHHAHSHQSPAAAAAAAAAALMSNPTAEANAILYAQQYHDFQHYAAMAAAVAASHQSILPPPPLDYNPHHPHHAYPPPHHPHPHHHHAAVAQAVAAATAANQQFHRQIAEQQHQQHNAEALARTHDMVNYQQQDQQIDNAAAEPSTATTRDSLATGGKVSATTTIGKIPAVPSSQQKLDTTRVHPYRREEKRD